VPNSGLKYGCAPLPSATVCSDKRYSCPTGSACNVTASGGWCHTAHGTSSLFNNVNAQTSLAHNADSVCDVIQGDLPSFCTCSPVRWNCTHIQHADLHTQTHTHIHKPTNRRALVPT
jgi:hypothetical protein